MRFVCKSNCPKFRFFILMVLNFSFRHATIIREILLSIYCVWNLHSHIKRTNSCKMSNTYYRYFFPFICLSLLYLFLVKLSNLIKCLVKSQVNIHLKAPIKRRSPKCFLKLFFINVLQVDFTWKHWNFIRLLNF